MYGAILGDIVGSPYEFDCNNYKAKDFPLFSCRSDFTDDTVMTLAVAKALLSTRGQDDAAIEAALVREMQQLGRAYPDRGYGTHFGGWLYEDDPQPYQSYGNGSAMRVSSAAWLAKDMAESLHLAQLTAEVTHDHPEGIKGAQAVAAAIFLARTGHGKAEIKAHVERKFGYDLSRSCDEIRPTYHHVESCQETVPQAIVWQNSSKSPTPRVARTPCVRLSGKKRVPVPTRGLKPDVSRFRQTFAGRKKKQDKGMASQAPPQPPLLPAVRAVSGI